MYSRVSTEPMCVIYIRNEWMCDTVNCGNRTIDPLPVVNFHEIDTVYLGSQWELNGWRYNTTDLNSAIKFKNVIK